MKSNSHIKETSVIEHLARARQKGYLASVELHNFGFSSKLFSFIDAFRDGMILFALLLFSVPKMLWPLAISFALWRGLKTTLQGFTRLDRLHTLIEEEKYEIDHNRDEEKLELIAIYEAKGFKSPLLEEVVATLMADDNRLLQVMLEEEMGVSFETLDHPIVTGSMATLGALTALGLVTALHLIPHGVAVGGLILLGLCGFYEAKKQKLPPMIHLTWTLASLIFIFAIAYFIALAIQGHFHA
jgi:VIT1/CCC1 family predicted Fe2+/Mn2+ transporter